MKRIRGGVETAVHGQGALVGSLAKLLLVGARVEKAALLQHVDDGAVAGGGRGGDAAGRANGAEGGQSDGSRTGGGGGHRAKRGRGRDAGGGDGGRGGGRAG